MDTGRNRLKLWARGVDTACFNPTRAVAAMREAWQVDDRRPAVIYVGRVSRATGIDLIAPFNTNSIAIGSPINWSSSATAPCAPI